MLLGLPLPVWLPVPARQAQAAAQAAVDAASQVAEAASTAAASPDNSTLGMDAAAATLQAVNAAEQAQHVTFALIHPQGSFGESCLRDSGGASSV